MELKATIMDENGMMRTITRLAHEIVERNKGVDDVVLVGILSRGLPLAKLIAQKIAKIEAVDLPVASLDITFYRDDLTKKQHDAKYEKGPFEVEIADKTVVLIDDVIFTGRTARAAIDALIDIARPRAIQLAVLIDRGHRELPIRPDYVGKNLPTSLTENVKVKVASVDAENGVAIYQRSR